MTSVYREINKLQPFHTSISAHVDGTRATLPNRPSRCTQRVQSSVGDRSSTVDRTRHVCRVAVRCCQHQTAHCRCLYRTCRR